MNLQKDTLRLSPRLCSGKNTLQLSGPILTVVFIVVFVTANCGIGAADDKSRFYSAQLMDDGSTVLFTYANTKYKLKSSSLFFGGSRSVYTKDRKIIGLYHMNRRTTEVIKKIDNEAGTSGRGNFTIRCTFGRKALLIRDSRNRQNETLPGGWFVLDVDTKDLIRIPIDEEMAGLGMKSWRSLVLAQSDGSLILRAFSPNQVEGTNKLGHIWLRSKNAQYHLLTDYGSYSGAVGNELIYYDHSLRTVRAYGVQTKKNRNMSNREYSDLQFYVTRYGKPQQGRSVRVGPKGKVLELSIEKDGKWQRQPFPIDMDPLH